MHDSIAEELKDHILDQAEVFEEEGADHEQALELAVREMGDPVETGVALDRIHRPHMSVKMLVLVSLISVLSLVSYGAMLFLAGDNSINGMEYWFHQQVKYTVTGFLLMLLVCRIDYSILGKWSRQIAGGILLFILLSLVMGVSGIWKNLWPAGWTGDDSDVRNDLAVCSCVCGGTVHVQGKKL